VHVVLGPASWIARGLPVLNLQALDFVFLASIVAGLLALRRLRLVEERGPSAAGVSLADVQAEIRAAVRSVSSVAGLRFLSSFPYGIVRRRPSDDDQGSG
jgi:hypothetical protein